ncbi:MAG: 3-deoxy-D-manno-octulosonic acid transferase, partial [Aestuariibacter sp.]|nr:3-deoxy-D-manno-octulosonic acid transferase [Aestuariibacter sp.]
MNPESPRPAYRLLSILLLPFWLLHGFVHGRNHGMPGYLRQRFWMPKSNSSSPTVWIHASSVGEVVAISPLVNALLTQGESILFTSFTA